MKKDLRIVAILFLLLLLGAFVFNRWVFRKDPPVDPNVFLALLSNSEPAFKEAERVFDSNWDDSYAAPLLDLASVTSNKETYTRILDILSKRTGQNFSNDINTAYIWLWSKPPTTYPNYVAFKSQLYGALDPVFAQFFVSGYTPSVRLDEIRWGGVPHDGIPPLITPRTITAQQATYLQDTNIVFGVTINGVPRAYPKRILAWHELFRDKVGGEPIVGVYCPLCGAILIYRSTVSGVVHEFGTSGFLYRSNKLMYDKFTHTLWSSMTGLPVVGPLVGKGAQLEALPVVTSTWDEWKQRHPDTTVLSADTGFRLDYREGAAYREYFGTDAIMFPVPKLDSRLRNKQEVLAMVSSAFPDQQLAIDTSYLEQHRVYSDKLGGVNIVVLTDGGGASRVYESGNHQFVTWNGDKAADKSQQLYNVTEDAIIAPDGEKLKRVAAHTAFWFGWQAFYPKTRLVK